MTEPMDRARSRRPLRHQVRWHRGAAAAGAATVLLLAACSTEPAAGSPNTDGGSDTRTIGVSMSFLNQFYAAAVEGMEDEAAAQGWKLVVLNANSNSSQQVNQVQNLVSQDVGAVIFAQLDAASGGASLTAANDAGVPVIAIDQVPAAGDYVTYIGSDSVRMGEQACDFLVETIGGSGDIAIVQGVPGSSTQLQRTEGCDRVLTATSSVSVVSTTSANWDQNTAANVFANVLTANPDLDGIFAQNDDMALGAATAIESADHPAIPMVTIDGFPAAYEAIDAGTVTATISQQPYLMGQLAVRNAITAIDGGAADIPKDQIQEAVLVTKENVEQARAAKYYGSAG
ncbi:sugar ABC transporter substrate-binding protein [Nakamurella leprariae]|uniref:Sugar ABC transporter substrate-binding protein n=1 Tax=Nakamurella leprariae TaxID=2803911 RepID=A0A939C2X1_9ACTN|nr:sugar ABC transporter substrate-binding protein [Nakamurella leprariae]MBM9468537.1 sugar ABC transporter substrate-binding protein [Nakamurella leprariae]